MAHPASIAANTAALVNPATDLDSRDLNFMNSSHPEMRIAHCYEILDPIFPKK